MSESDNVQEPMTATELEERYRQLGKQIKEAIGVFLTPLLKEIIDRIEKLEGK